jgi:hypothetical protein
MPKHAKAAVHAPTHQNEQLCKFHTDLSALAGHDGYGPPGGADDVGHYLHHRHFECNYGFSFPNYLDRAFGTYENGDRWLSNEERQALGLPGGNKQGK